MEPPKSFSRWFPEIFLKIVGEIFLPFPIVQPVNCQSIKQVPVCQSSETHPVNHYHCGRSRSFRKCVDFGPQINK